MTKNLGSIMKKMQDLQSKMEAIQEDMAQRSFSTSVGGGAVKATVTGKGFVIAMEISVDARAVDDNEMLTDLIMLAVNTAKSEADKAQAEAIKELTGGLPLPLGMNVPV